MTNRLRERRIQLGLTQSQVADRAGICDRTYVGYEHEGVTPLVTRAIQIAKALNTTVEYLYTDRPTNNKIA